MNVVGLRGQSERLLRLMLLLATGCGHSSVRSGERCCAVPRSGLYEAIDRQCENPLQETDFCPMTQYLEIASGATFDVSDERRVLAFWFCGTARISRIR